MNRFSKSIMIILFALAISYVGGPTSETAVSKPAEAQQKVKTSHVSKVKSKAHRSSEEKRENATTTPNHNKKKTAQVANVPVNNVQNKASAGESVQSLIRNAAAKYGVPRATAQRIAHCESTTGQNLVNYSYTAPDGSHPTGVYQFTRETWYDLARARGWQAVDERLNHKKNIDMFAWAYANGHAWRWECK